MAPKLSKLVTGTVYKNFFRGHQHFLLARASTNLNPLLGAVIFAPKFTYSQGPLKRVGGPRPKVMWEAPTTTLHR